MRWTGGGQVVKLAVLQQPGNANVDSPIGVVKVALQDANGKAVATANETVSLTLESKGTAGVLTGNAQVAAVDGIATFPALTIGQPGRSYTLRASSGKLPPVTSAAFDISNELAAPLITPPGGSFSGPVWVLISSATPGATIRFTTDGTDPVATSPAFTALFQVTGSTVIKAVAQKDGFIGSTAAKASINIAGHTPYGLTVRRPGRGVKLPATAEALPATLSGTDIFSDQDFTASVGVPYALNSPAWADGAQLQHWVILPESGRIGFAPTGEYQWPGGTVFVQHFELVTNQATGTRRRLETRLLVLDATGSFGYGATYRWRKDNRDADLVDANGKDEVLKITDAAGGTHDQKWSYPARGLCYMCHTPTAGFVLGPKTRQLNGNFAYPGGRTDNQLRTWNYLQMFTPNLDESALPSYAHTVKIDDTSASLETRVRSYLDANCASCHRPNGAGAVWDARFDTPLAKQGIINGEVRNTFSLAEVKVVTPGDPAKSMMHLRLSSTAPVQQMPPVMRNVVDATALDVLTQWIRASASPPAKAGPSR